MQKLADNDIHARLEALVARRTATKALKFINTRKTSNWDAYELQGNL